MSHFPEIYPFGLFQCAVTYVKKTVRKNNFVTFDIQLLQEKAKEVHLCFSVITEKNHLHYAGVWKHKRSWYESNSYDVFKLKNIKVFTVISVIVGAIHIQQLLLSPFREMEY